MTTSKTQHARETALRMAQNHNPDWTIGEVSFNNRQAVIELITPSEQKRLTGRSYYDCMVKLKKEIFSVLKANGKMKEVKP